MRALVTLLPLSVLWSCSSLDAPEIKQCEEYLLAKLKAPATYKRVEASSFAYPDYRPERRTVIIKYDAANSYNAPIRDTQICQFPSVKGQPDTSNYIDFDADSEEEIDNMMTIDALTNL